MLSRFIVVATILSPPGLSQTNAEPPAVTLAEAIRRSERVQPVLVRAADDVRAAAAQRRSALGAYRAEAESKSPRIQSAAANAAAARASTRASRSAYWPSLTLAANTGWNGSRTTDYDLFNQRQVSLSLRWNLFDGFDRELTIVQREANWTWPRPAPRTRSVRYRRS